MAKFYIYRFKLNGVKPAMRVLKTEIGAIHNIEGRIAFMRNKVECNKKMEKNQITFKCNLNVFLTESIPSFSLFVIVIYLFLLSSILV